MLIFAKEINNYFIFKIMINTKRFIYILFFSFISLLVFSQETLKIQGKVFEDATNDPMPGVTVAVKGRAEGTTTDLNGSYTINAKKGETLIFTFVGMQPVSVKVNSTTINARMKEENQNLDEIVVIGYGISKKSDLTGSVVSVKNKELTKTSFSSFDQGLQGRIAGVEVVQGDATPGGSAYIQIRGVSTMMGSTEPLYIIDGAPYNISNSVGTTSAAGYSNTNPLSMLSPSDIESIEILKDASATAIYGSQGANGVVMITTKRGKDGKAKISFSTTQSVSVLSKKIQVLNARQYAEYKNEAGLGNTPSRHPDDWDYPIGPTTIKKISPAALEDIVGEGIDWQDEIYRPAWSQDYQLSVTGGRADNKYAVMLGYMNQNGILKNTAFDRLNARVNIDNKLTDFLSMSLSGSFTHSKNRMVKTSTNDGSSKAGGVVRKAITYSPIPPLLKDADGNIIGVSDVPASDVDMEDPSYENNWGATPLRFLNEATIKQTLSNFTGNIEFRFNIIKGLQFKTRLSGVYYVQKNDNYFPRTLNEGKSNNGLAQLSDLNYSSFITENLLTYNLKISKKHKLDFLFGFTYDERQNRSLKTESSGFADDLLTFWASSSALLTQPVGVSANKWNLISYFGRANYNFDDRYLVTYTVRTDGSSKFAKNSKWATFQSFALAWRVNQERFLKPMDWISTLKLRLSYGESGNQGLSPYQSLSRLSPTTASLGNQLVNAYYETAQANPNLRWETTSQFNLGLDFGFFNERIGGSVNWYLKDTRDLLQKISMAPSTGFKEKTVNSGKIRNTGVEIDLNVRPIMTRSFAWDMNLNWYTNKNEVRDLGPVKEQFASTLGSAYGLNVQPFIQKVGYPIGAIYGYVFDGIFQNQAEVDANYSIDDNGNKRPIQSGQAVGMLKFRDINGDGVVNESDQTIIGDTNPDFFFGFNNTFSYKRFELGVFVSGVIGGDIINTNFIMPRKLNGESNIPAFLYAEAWRGDGTSNTSRLIKSGNEDPKKFSRQYIEKRTYVRIKNINLSYNVNVKKMKGISAMKMSLNAINPFTFTKYRGYDPEVSANSSALSRGVDMGNYPQARVFSFGLNVEF